MKLVKLIFVVVVVTLIVNKVSAADLGSKTMGIVDDVAYCNNEKTLSDCSIAVRLDDGELVYAQAAKSLPSKQPVELFCNALGPQGQCYYTIHTPATISNQVEYYEYGEVYEVLQCNNNECLANINDGDVRVENIRTDGLVQKGSSVTRLCKAEKEDRVCATVWHVTQK